MRDGQQASKHRSCHAHASTHGLKGLQRWHPTDQPRGWSQPRRMHSSVHPAEPSPPSGVSIDAKHSPGAVGELDGVDGALGADDVRDV